jgi:DNA helicase II / ATP-dependent DNA helicase PcrA
VRVIYNRDYLFKGVPKNKHETYFKRLLEFIRDVQKEKHVLSDHTIRKYDIKKMRGTRGIFKFVLDSTDASRCLIEYESKDDQIFSQEPGIALLRIVSHKEQGELGRQMEHAFRDYSDFLEHDEAEGDDRAIDQTLGRKYMRTIYVHPEMADEDFLRLLMDDDIRYVFKPSEKQLSVLQSTGPTLLLGCAGSGKTLVEISLALKNAHALIDQGYFTFTSQLKDVAQSIYAKYEHMPGLKGTTSFHSLRDYTLAKLGIGIKDYMSFERFKTWAKQTMLKKKYHWINRIGIVNLWIEIRGLIKGYMGNDFYRNLEIKNADRIFNEHHLKMLSGMHAIKKISKTLHDYQIANGMKLSEYVQTQNELINAMFHHDFDSPLIDRFTYTSLKDAYSHFTKEERENIYDFAQNVYQPYLQENGLYDDNDLARKNILEIHRTFGEQLDYVLIDEIQDLTEMQIYMLLRLARNPANVILTGDVSQVINPTFFKKGRTGVIFKNRLSVDWDRNKVLTLDENYRNSRNIVEVAKKIVQIRQEILGKYTEDIVEESKELETTEGLPILVDIPENDVFDAIRLWLDVPKVAIITANESSKDRLNDALGVNRHSSSNIYTVQEIKGQEFDKAIVYNVLSDHEDVWERIMNQETKERTAHYQYYFNLFYVAITRAKRNIFLFERNRDLDILKSIRSLFEIVTENVHAVMDLSSYMTEENMLAQAKENFIKEDYKRARVYYLQLNNKKQAAICTGYAFLQDGQFKRGIEHLYQFKEHHKEAYRYTDEKDTLLFHLILGYRTHALDIPAISTKLKNRSMIELMETIRSKPIRTRVLSDAIEIMSKVHHFRITKQIEEMIR